jgi:hypothetical protein
MKKESPPLKFDAGSAGTVSSNFHIVTTLRLS